MLVFVLMMLAAAHAFRPANKAELKAAIQNCAAEVGGDMYLSGWECKVDTDGQLDDNGQHISDWVTSDVTDMSLLFQNFYKFGQANATRDIFPLNWDVSSVTNMSHMFQWAIDFEADLSSWNVQPNVDITNMFEGAQRFNHFMCGSWIEVVDESIYNDNSRWGPKRCCAAGTRVESNSQWEFTSNSGCTDCTAGTYSDENGATVCKDCSAGKWSDETGQVLESTCKECAAGLTSTVGSTGCSSCSIGKFRPEGADNCVDCGAGTYADEPGAVVCKDCSAGKWSATEGLSADNQCDLCSAGKWSDQTGLTADNQCTECVAGKSSDVTGADSNTCVPCVYPRTSGWGYAECLDVDALCLANNYLSLGNSQHLVQLVDAFDANAMANKLRCGC